MSKSLVYGLVCFLCGAMAMIVVMFAIQRYNQGIALGPVKAEASTCSARHGMSAVTPRVNRYCQSLGYSYGCATGAGGDIYCFSSSGAGAQVNIN